MHAIHVENWTVETGDTTTMIDFTPKKGEIIGACIYQDDETKVGSAALKAQDGSNLVDLVDLRHWRNRETSYGEGFIPISAMAQPMQLNVKLKVAAAANVTGQLVLIYKNTPKEC
jgi:hypothetical protein